MRIRAKREHYTKYNSSNIVIKYTFIHIIIKIQFFIGGKMKHKKTVKQKLAEIGYKKPNLKKKMGIIEKSFSEVKKMLGDKN